MITSGIDPFRSYELHRRIPEVIERMRVRPTYWTAWSQSLRITGMEGGHSEIISRVSRLLRRMADDRPDTKGAP